MLTVAPCVASCFVIMVTKLVNPQCFINIYISQSVKKVTGHRSIYVKTFQSERTYPRKDATHGRYNTTDKPDATDWIKDIKQI